MTLNQVIQRLQSLSLSHKQLRSFYFGDVVDFLANGDKVYPALCASILPGSISKADRATVYNFRIFLCDLVNVSEKSKSNELEVQSDLTSISEDILALMNDPSYSGSWDVSQSINTNYATEDLEDMVGAVFFDIAISTRYDSNRCQVPTITASTMNEIYYGYASAVPATEADILALPQSSFSPALTLQTGTNRIFVLAIPQDQTLQLAYNQTSPEDVTSEFDLTYMNVGGYPYKILIMQNDLAYSVNQEIIITLL